jgi:hypothetical protein
MYKISFEATMADRPTRVSVVVIAREGGRSSIHKIQLGAS